MAINVSEHFWETALNEFIRREDSNTFKSILKRLFKDLPDKINFNTEINFNYKLHIGQTIYHNRIKLTRYFSVSAKKDNTILELSDKVLIECSTKTDQYRYSYPIDYNKSFTLSFHVIKPKIHRIYGPNGITKYSLTPTKIDELCELLHYYSTTMDNIPKVFWNIVTYCYDDDEIINTLKEIQEVLEEYQKLAILPTKECDICMEQEKLFCKLSCSHELCNKCAKVIYKNNQETPCPFCRNKQIILFDTKGNPISII